MAAKPEPFGYFRPTLDGWEDCAPTAAGARALYEAPVDVPTLTDAEIESIGRAILDHGYAWEGLQPWVYRFAYDVHKAIASKAAML